jgi:hypothetical protein
VSGNLKQSLRCLLGRHQWRNENGGGYIIVSTGQRVCYACGAKDPGGEE